MACRDCEEVQDRGDVAYYRLGKANVGVIGCDAHVNQIFRAVDGRAEDRVIVRVKGDIKTKQ